MQQRSWVRSVAGVALAAVAAGMSLTRDVTAAAEGGSGQFTFASIGDVQYGPEGEEQFPALLADINADRTLSFVAMTVTSRTAARSAATRCSTTGSIPSTSSRHR